MRSLVLLGGLASAPALAQTTLDCSARDPEVCAATNAMVASIHADLGFTMLTQSSSNAKSRPANLYTRLMRVNAAAEAGGCTIDGWSAGVYDSSAAAQSWDGALESLDASYSERAAGTCGLAPPVWTGATTTGDAEFLLGDVFGLHNASFQVVGNIGSDGFKAGYWIRRVGNRGVFATLTGTCPGGTDPAAVLDPWWDGELAPEPPVGETALRLDGASSAFIPLGGAAAETNFGIEAWVRTTAEDGMIAEIYSASPLGADRSIYFQNGQVCFYVYTPAFSVICSTGTYNDGQWHHVAGTLGVASPTAFHGQWLVVDGIIQANAPTVTTSAFTWDQGIRVGYGYLGPGGAEVGLVGDIDELRVWNVNRSPNFVFVERDVDLAPGTPGLQGYWKMDDAGDGVFDSTSNAFHASSFPIPTVRVAPDAF